MKKLLLFLSFALLISNINFAQVPANDLYQNAALVDQSPFGSSLRLDLATPSAGGQIGCDFGAFGLNIVYYKFTASDSGTLTINLTDISSPSLTLGNTLAIVYTAPNLNITNENQLTLHSPCAFGTGTTTIAVTQGQSYYILVHRDVAGASTSVTITIPLIVPPSERNALIDFYNSTDGTNWVNNTNWNTAGPVSTWHGITVQKVSGNNHVTGISFNDNNLQPSIPSSIGNLTELKEFLVINTARLFGSSNSIPLEIGNLSKLQFFWIEHWNLEGAIPSTFGDLSALTTLVIRNTNMDGAIPSSLNTLPVLGSFSINENNFSGVIPNFTSTPLTFFRIQDNNFQFGDFENEFANYQANIPAFTYTPQARLSEDTEQIVTIGDDVTLQAVSSGSNNQYQWFLNNTLVTGETNATLNLTNIQSSQLGRYRCDVTSTVVTGLTLYTGNFDVGLNPTIHPDYDALVAFYNSTNGANWTDNTNWLDSTKPISSWIGITETNGRVTRVFIQSNNLSGTIPAELTNLTELKELWLQGNPDLTGNLPSNLGNLVNLEKLLLSSSNLGGNIPASIQNCTSLNQLSIANNNFEGTIPDLTSLSLLEIFLFINNNFQFGDFENEFTTYQTNINTFVYTPQAKLSPDTTQVTTIGDDVTLEAVSSGNNNQYQWFLNNVLITGETNAALNITNIQSNQFGDYRCDVTSTVVTGLTLQTGNFTVDQDPTTHPDYDALVAFYNSTNGANWTDNTNWLDATKPISSWFGIFEANGRVTGINLPFNQMFGEIPPEIGNLTNLEFLYIFGNWLSGTIPPEIGNLTELTELWINTNDFSGEIPIEIWNLTNVVNMNIGRQNSRQLLLSNGIPTEIQNMTNLVWLDLTRVPLTLPIQPELFNLPNLTRLRMIECGLTGTFPAGFATIDNVIVSGNEFEGTIPSEILNSTGNSFLDLTNNYFNFSDLEPLVIANNYTTLGYTPQRTKDVEQTVETPAGNDIVLTVDDTDIGGRSTTIATTAMNNVYQWFKDGVAITGANATSYTITNAQPTDSGVYYCEITNPLLPGLIIIRANITLNVGALSIDDNSINTLKIYPNPVSDWLTINLGNIDNATILLYDITGKIIFKKSINSTIENIDISAFETGIYLLTLKSDIVTITKRIIKK